MAAEVCGIDQAGRRPPLIFDIDGRADTAATRATPRAGVAIIMPI
jgi:hypothetical protein